ncbi:MaoC/PaaZ C-terminal domain-containing protein [Mycobacterium sp. CVI_P3]|uniref:MaoC/PaaZ C-terminal domain-containing protein n=1 Tax=Mycobacterium pinniadriaticum TaxID=2994102 RepID=A0ABT3SMV3_9MYCO|nr:MaoC/PaaZ C-terminal domain-containing protein [Mycobacterium pinniadriaticum]MCX2934437.1 MaoC/PaaZ C-terminal domain-containing protein [Mycobacterium pinniadriaticum]MCX2940860.1 MaoC/PaaZ C-terminal domain-containing protein [Mycobacterium pinniadriaticum]
MSSWDDLVIGYAPPPRTDKPLRVTDFVRYQGASGDFNPIHHDPAVAAKAGYPQVFAVGMLGAGSLAAYVSDWLGPQNIRKFGVRFKEQAWPGDELTYTAMVTDRREVNDERLVDLELGCTRQTGGLHLTGWATVVVTKRQETCVVVSGLVC